jgi:hypothetical protein
MAEAGTWSEARAGSWLWAQVGAILVAMELILVAALGPRTWQAQKRL